ncbi:MAG TPA: methyltransferase domain-containing protein [Candidatus Dormibacteraeota bacterium]|nr:methyltransferase domain-containing protein [Candidatus Dormibacteraeota bacterium]
MLRTNSEEILDSDQCPAVEAETSLRDLCRINRWFGGVATTRKLIERVASATGKKHFSLLEVAAGFGEVPRTAARQLAVKGITLDITDLDRVPSHLRAGHRALVADALALPFRDRSFDLVSCSLFAHHLEPADLARFVNEASRVGRCAVLINDLIRHPLHLALVYAGFPLMRSYVSRVDGVASVRRAYVPDEVRKILSHGKTPGKLEISTHYLFRMGVILWKGEATPQASLRSAEAAAVQGITSAAAD